MSLQAKMFTTTEGGGGSKIPVGIHRDTTFENIVSEGTWTDIKYAQPSTGRGIHKRLFDPTGGNPLEGETIQDAYNREVKQNLGHIVQVMTAVLGSEVVENFEAETYKEFVAKATALLQGAKGTKVDLKVVPDYKEKKYPDLPRYGTYVVSHTGGSEVSLKYSNKELEAIREMEQKRATDSGDGSMSSEDTDSLI